MNKIFYAQDATDLDAVESFLLQQIQAAPSNHWTALVDGAFDYGQPKPLQRLGGSTCYTSKDLEGLQSASLQLVDLSSVGHTKLRRLLEHCSTRPMLSVIGSTLPLAQLIQTWLPYHWVSTDDGQRLLLRFADTRVLPVLPTILEPEQWASLAAPIRQWLYVARDGQPASCALPPQEVPPAKAIELSITQLGQLLNSAEPDILLDFFAENLSDSLPKGISHSELHRRAALIVNLAHAHGIEAWADVVALALAEWQTHGAFREKPALAALLQSGDWPANELGERLLEENLL